MQFTCNSTSHPLPVSSQCIALIALRLPHCRHVCPTQALGGVAAHAAQELALTVDIAALDAKNYQLWNYRRRLVLALGPAALAEQVRGCGG